MQDFLDDAGGPAVGQALFAAVGVVDEPGVVEAEEMQDRGLEVVRSDDVLDCAVADFVGGAERLASLDSAAGKPDREALAVVVAAGAGVEVALADRQAADLAAPVDEGRFQQPALLRSVTRAAAGLSVRRQMAGSAWRIAV